MRPQLAANLWGFFLASCVSSQHGKQLQQSFASTDHSPVRQTDSQIAQHVTSSASRLGEIEIARRNAQLSHMQRELKRLHEVIRTKDHLISRLRQALRNSAQAVQSRRLSPQAAAVPDTQHAVGRPAPAPMVSICVVTTSDRCAYLSRNMVRNMQRSTYAAHRMELLILNQGDVNCSSIPADPRIRYWHHDTRNFTSFFSMESSVAGKKQWETASISEKRRFLKELLLVFPELGLNLSDAVDKHTPWRHTDGMLETGLARNVLLSRARGDVVLAFDDDDFYAPDYVRCAPRSALNRYTLCDSIHQWPS